MSTQISVIFCAWAVFLAAPSAAQSFEIFPPVQRHGASVVYRHVADANPLPGLTYGSRLPDMEDGANIVGRLKLFRMHALGMTSYRSNIFFSNDQAAFRLNAPMPLVDGALSLAGTASQTSPDGMTGRCLQILSLMATRRIDAEISYSARINEDARLDAAIAYRLHSSADTAGTGVRLSLQYSAKF